ncbi:MAG: DUF433 domain-containing protein [Chitinophagales bacterium]
MKENSDIIEINPNIMLGKPVIKGTRITVELILEELSAGKTHKELLEAYPNLSNEGILAALAFASKSLKGEKTYIPFNLIQDLDNLGGEKDYNLSA